MPNVRMFEEYLVNTVFLWAMFFSQKIISTDFAGDSTMNAYYFRFRRQIAHFALAELVRLLKTSGPLILGVLGPAMMAFVALLCAPLLYACTRNMTSAILLITIHTIVVSIPFCFLNKRTLPQEVLTFFRPLPVSWAIHTKADAVVAWLVLRPLGLAYLLSMGVWLWQFPEWIHGIWLEGILVTIGSFVLTWLSVTLSMQFQWHPAPLLRFAKSGQPIRDFRQKKGLSRCSVFAVPEFLFCYSLLWLPLWRKDGGAVGRRQILLLAGTLVAIYFWMWPFSETNGEHVWLAIISSALIISMITLGDTALSRHLEVLNPVLASLPIPMYRLRVSAKMLAIAPACLALAVFGIGALHLDVGQIRMQIALIYIALVTLFLIVIPWFTLPGTPARTAVVALSVTVLSAIGSELWL